MHEGGCNQKMVTSENVENEYNVKMWRCRASKWCATALAQCSSAAALPAVPLPVLLALALALLLPLCNPMVKQTPPTLIPPSDHAIRGIPS